jgi:threonine/homoserine/homoserine lactone efflux protein
VSETLNSVGQWVIAVDQNPNASYVPTFGVRRQRGAATLCDFGRWNVQSRTRSPDHELRCRTRSRGTAGQCRGCGLIGAINPGHADRRSGRIVIMFVSSAAALGMALTALGMVLTPGPNMMYLVSRSISQGRVAGLIYMTLANLGLAVVFVVVPWLYIAFKAAGATYLGYLAWQALRPGGRGLFEPADLPRDRAWKLFRTGLLTNLLNPKAAIMYLALIPQFVDPGRGHAAVQGLTLGGIQITVSMIVNSLLILAAGSVAALIKRSPSWATWQRRITGGLLGGVTILLAREVPARARV